MSDFEYLPVAHPATRHPLLPRFIKYNKTHPLWPWGPAYVYEWDTTPSLQESFYKEMYKRKVPGRFEAELERDGEMWLKPYEAVFVRHIGESLYVYLVFQTSYNMSTGATDPHKDILQAMVTDEGRLKSISPTFFEELLQVRDEMLGPMHLRSEEAPTRQSDGSLKGGVLFERSETRAVPVHSNTRCYQYQGLSTEVPKSLSSVNVNSKTPIDEDRALKSRILKACQFI